MFQIVPTELNPPRHPGPPVLMWGKNTCVVLGHGVRGGAGAPDPVYIF